VQSTQEITRTHKQSGLDPATILVDLMHELSLDIGPESQTIDITLPTWDTYAYLVTTFLVNGYEVKQSESRDSSHKSMTGVIHGEGWRITLWVYDVPLTPGEIEAAANADNGEPSSGGGADERARSVHRSSVSGGAGPDKGTAPVPATKRKRRTRKSDGILTIGEVKA
jgi:hypothetical protein